MSSQFQYGSNMMSVCGDNEHKVIDKSEASIWWKITGA